MTMLLLAVSATVAWADPSLELLKDARICLDGAGGYYLTGTAGTHDKAGKPDFDYNQGVPLWHSTDLKSWKPLGFAWDRVAIYKKGRPKLGIWLDWSAPADRIDGLLAQATTTPQFCRFAKDWFIVCAMNGQNILLQKSTTGKAEGPYDDFAYLATRGGQPSLLVDDDRTVYLVFADAWIAKLKPDLKELSEEPRPLLPVQNSDRLTLGDPGVALFKRGGKYNVLAARWQVRDGRPSHDAVLWTASTIFGPYQETSVVLPGSGTVSVFADANGKWHAVSSQPGTLRIVEVPQP
jgi:hypothetical protein